MPPAAMTGRAAGPASDHFARFNAFIDGGWLGRLTKLEAAVWWAYERHADAGGRAYPGNARIARYLGGKVSEYRISQARAALCELGLLERLKEGGGGMAGEYRVCVPPQSSDQTAAELTARRDPHPPAICRGVGEAPPPRNLGGATPLQKVGPTPLQKVGPNVPSNGPCNGDGAPGGHGGSTDGGPEFAAAVGLLGGAEFAFEPEDARHQVATFGAAAVALQGENFRRAVRAGKTIANPRGWMIAALSRGFTSPPAAAAAARPAAGIPNVGAAPEFVRVCREEREALGRLPAAVRAELLERARPIWAKRYKGTPFPPAPMTSSTATDLMCELHFRPQVAAGDGAGGGLPGRHPTGDVALVRVGR